MALLSVYALTGALMPDLDAAHSKIKYFKVAGLTLFVPLLLAIYRDFGHRGLLHSLWGWSLWTLLLLPLSYWISWLPVATLSIGYAIHLLAAACTPSGIPILFPKPRKFHLLPKHLWAATGSLKEDLVFIVFVLLLIDLLYLHIIPSGYHQGSKGLPSGLQFN